ncbi:MAG TPA: hypothetical protein VN364_10815 [Bellilinea sp.]|nr:hypothetical protein [Bellilinea sp.]
MESKNIWLIVIAVVVVISLCMTALVITGVFAWRVIDSQGGLGAPDAVPEVPKQDEPAPVPLDPNLNPEPASAGAVQTLENLRGAEIPVNDPLDLAERLLGIADIPETVEPSGPYAVGDRLSFWVSNTATNETFRVAAVLRAVVDTAYFWIEEGIDYQESDLTRLANAFNDEIYPVNQAFFGSEWSPGIDGDPRLFILYAKNLGGSTAAYFSSIDSVNPQAHPYSNAHEMFMINADSVTLGEEYTFGVLAHEFQHMIHWNNDRNEDSWLNEGFAELAAFLNGYDPGGFDYLFSLEPDMQLTDWPLDADARGPHYGSSFLFVAYFLDRYGEQATQALVANPENSMDSVDAVLEDLRTQGLIDPNSGSADDLFADWTAANYLNDPEFEGERYAYHRYQDLPNFAETERVSQCDGGWESRSVSQYGTDYIQFDCNGPAELAFQGASEVGVLSMDAHSGEFAFWSNTSDESNMRLRQTFDFSEVQGALTLEYAAWYALEVDYDYVYLTASTDGKTWAILNTPSCTNTNPSGNNYGCGYNGNSGGYRNESVDLSQFAGKQVTLQFDYVTDAAINAEGFLLDDIAIPEIGYSTDFETDDGGWQAEGFVRIENRLPQTFRLTVIEEGRQPSVRYVEVDATGKAEVLLDPANGNVITVAISGTTRFTREKASYGFSVAETP